VKQQAVLDSYSDPEVIRKGRADYREKCLEAHLEIMCDGETNWYSTWWGIYSRLNSLPDFYCEETTKECKTDLYQNELPETYIERVLADKPEEIKEDDFVQKLYQSMKGERETFRVLQIADPHIDLDYAVGSQKDCNVT